MRSSGSFGRYLGMNKEKKEVVKVNQITEGVIWQQILIFFLPILFGTFFQQLYNTADAMIVGHFLGKQALAAVGGTTGTLINLLVGFFVGLSSGATVVISQHYGANKEDLREYIGTVDDDKLFRQINATLKKTFGLWGYKPEGKENIRCLCPKCLNDYIHNPDYIVRRLDPFAKRKDRCDKCDGDGWDYVVTDRYSSKKEKRGSNDRK